MLNLNPVLKFFQNTQTPFGEIALDAGIAPSKALEKAGIKARQVLRSTLLEDGSDNLLLITPADQPIDLDGLNHRTKRNFRQINPESARMQFPGCEIIPPFGSFFDIPELIDNQVLENQTLFFALEKGPRLFGLSTKEFKSLHPRALFTSLCKKDATKFSGDDNRLVVPPDLHQYFENGKLSTGESLLNRLERVEDLPVLPVLARRLLEIRNRPNASAAQLAKVVEVDPTLAAQVMRYSRSAFFGYQGKLDSVQDAIARVLGYEAVLNMAIGLAAGRTFHLKGEGPIGLKSLWHNAIYCAAMAQVLSTQMPERIRPKSGMAYLAGLLHNFGYFLLGHVYTDEYLVLNRLLSVNPNIPARRIENYLLGVDHGEIGARLMEIWDMPKEIVNTARYHHQVDYAGEHAEYVHLVQMTDCLLPQFDDHEELKIETTQCRATGISAGEVEIAISRLSNSTENFDDMVRRLAA